MLIALIREACGNPDARVFSLVCKMTGTTTVATVHFDGTPHDYTPVDIGVLNECDAVIMQYSFIQKTYLRSVTIQDVSKSI